MVVQFWPTRQKPHGSQAKKQRKRELRFEGLERRELMTIVAGGMEMPLLPPGSMTDAPALIAAPCCESIPSLDMANAVPINVPGGTVVDSTYVDSGDRRVWVAQVRVPGAEGNQMRVYSTVVHRQTGQWVRANILLSEFNGFGDHYAPVAARIGNGNVVVAWNYTGQGSNRRILFRIIDPNAASPISSMRQANADASNWNEIRDAGIRANRDGTFSILWTNYTQGTTRWAADFQFNGVKIRHDYSNDSPNPTPVPPAPPTGLTAQATSSASVALTWRDNSNNESGFRVEWREAGKAWQATNVAANSTRHTVGGLRPATTYEFRVRAFNDVGPSAYAGPVSVRTQPPSNGGDSSERPDTSTPIAPTRLTAQAVSRTSVTLTWRDNSNNERGFRVEWREVGKAWQATNVAANSTRHAVGGLRPATRYEFRVRAFNDVGPSAYAGPVGVQTQSPPNGGGSSSHPDTSTPIAPTRLTAQAASRTSVTLTWRDNSNNERGFRVEWREVGKAWQATNVAANSTRFTVAGLRPETRYEFRVCAFNDVGPSAYAGPVSVQSVPSAPTRLTAQAASRTSVTLTWRDNSNNERGFRVEWREAGRAWQATNVTANSTRHTVGGLRPATRYEFRIRAFNDRGNSGYASTTFWPSRPFNLIGGERLLPGQEIRSADNRFRFTLQTDGNLVLYGPRGRALWSTRTAGRRVTSAIMQTDGNFVLYNNSTPVWHTRTNGRPGARLVVLNTGNVVIRGPGGRVLWQARQI